MPSPSRTGSFRIAVIGAGTMGSGIALTALLADLTATLYDVNPASLKRPIVYPYSPGTQTEGHKYQIPAPDRSLEELGDPGIVIEAAPEDLTLKRYASPAGRLYPEPALLATNTSTLPVTAIADHVEHHRAGGMHFLTLRRSCRWSIIPGRQTGPETLQALAAVAKKMGKQPIVVRDTPGFIVNRVAPILRRGPAAAGRGRCLLEAIDRMVRDGAGFRMGPFQLMDLIGIDINLAATRSIWEQVSEPRYRPPHPGANGPGRTAGSEDRPRLLHL